MVDVRKSCKKPATHRLGQGVPGLVCALVIGKRKGFGTENLAPYNLVYSVIGASLLWVGWFGFNAGSAIVGVNTSDAAGGLAGNAPAHAARRPWRPSTPWMQESRRERIF